MLQSGRCRPCWKSIFQFSSVHQPNNSDKLLGICSSTQEMYNVYTQEPNTRSLHHLRLVLLLAGAGPGPGDVSQPPPWLLTKDEVTAILVQSSQTSKRKQGFCQGCSGPQPETEPKPTTAVITENLFLSAFSKLDISEEREGSEGNLG